MSLSTPRIDASPAAQRVPFSPSSQQTHVPHTTLHSRQIGTALPMAAFAIVACLPSRRPPNVRFSSSAPAPDALSAFGFIGKVPIQAQITPLTSKGQNTVLKAPRKGRTLQGKGQLSRVTALFGAMALFIGRLCCTHRCCSLLITSNCPLAT